MSRLSDILRRFTNRLAVILFAGAIPVQAAPGPVEESFPDASPDAVLHLDVGTDGDEKWLGFGWSRPEGSAERFRWIRELEADVRFEVDEPEDLTLWIRAQPLYLNWKQQKIGVYVNNRFVSERECPPAPGFDVYRIEIPAEYLTPGENRLTLRLGYRARFKYDKRELSLGVDRILLGAP